MKKIISVLIVMALLVSVGLIGVYASIDKMSQSTAEYLTSLNSSEFVDVTVDIDVNINNLDFWEFANVEGYDAERFESDHNYFTQCYQEYNEYKNEQAEIRQNKMMEFYLDVFGGAEEELVSCLPHISVLQFKIQVDDIERLLSFQEVKWIATGDNSDGGVDVEFNGKPEEFCKEVYIAEHLRKSTDDEVAKHINIAVYGSVGEAHLLFRAEHMGVDAISEEILGDYIFGSDCIHSYDNSTGIYVTSTEGGLWTLSEAYENNWLNLDILAQFVPYVYMIGDSDRDLVLTVKDATIIQKILADLDSYKDVLCNTRPEDMDRNGVVNINDATAIQKHIAGLEY